MTDSIVIGHMKHAYLQTDGTMNFPNSREGDMLKQAFSELTELEAGKAFDKAKIAEQKLRIAELREELFNTTADLETSQAQLDALKPYTMHDRDCSKTMIKRRCSCGLDAALNGEDDG